MLIPVVYPNGSHDLVKDFYLDFLIGERKIERFKRSSGWVHIDAPDIRGKRRGIHYSGPERRQQNEDDVTNKTEQPIEFYPVHGMNK